MKKRPFLVGQIFSFFSKKKPFIDPFQNFFQFAKCWRRQLSGKSGEPDGRLHSTDSANTTDRHGDDDDDDGRLFGEKNELFVKEVIPY